MGRQLIGGSVLVLLYAVLILTCFSCTKSFDSQPGTTVYINYSDSTGYQMIRNGSPFFIKGASGISQLSVLREYGANTVRVYHPDSLGQVLDQAQRLGLAVVADLPLPAYDSRYPGLSDPEELARQSEILTSIVERYKDHPALLFWMLGNEVFQSGYGGGFIKGYNELARTLRELDPDHPISTSVVRHQLATLQLSWRGVEVDFLSLNIFGKMPSFEETKYWLTAIWRGPYLFSEWSFNGPWESESTAWGVPIESPSHTKAEHLRQRYTDYIAPIDDGRFLGSLVFFWGHKQEQTPSWFSLFTEDGRTSEMAFTLRNLWQNTQVPYPGPSIEYLLLDGKGARDNILLSGGWLVKATAKYTRGDTSAGMTYRWRIAPEDWLGTTTPPEDIVALRQLLVDSDRDALTFRLPTLPGPYRVFLTVSDTTGYFATANVPFYVLSDDNAK